MNPYLNAPSMTFWKSAVAECSALNPVGIYKKKFKIEKSWNIATAGSCFAQHISTHLRNSGFNVIDEELPPYFLPDSQHQRYGYKLYSARHGNIYTVKQLLQLSEEIINNRPLLYPWKREGKYFDAFRPTVEPEGLDSETEVLRHREYHIQKLKSVFRKMDLFIFTLGLTEAWHEKDSGVVFPTAPGVLADCDDFERIEFKNFSFYECVNDFYIFQENLRKIRENDVLPRMILTVSPVPLTATASAEHVLTANCYSKSTLRSVAGYLCDSQSHIDYFPSYEIITNPASRATFYDNNLRTVSREGVGLVMDIFDLEHGIQKDLQKHAKNRVFNAEIFSEPQCEEAIIEEFNR